MSQRLLSLLTDLPQSGKRLGAALGVGRVTVNTLAHKLTAQGVPLVITRGGYALEPGTPAPQLVEPLLAGGGGFGRAMRYLGTVDSTQDEVRRWADEPGHPAPHGAVVVAEQQSQGRGRRGRVWDTTHGTLVFSVLLRGAGDGAHAGGAQAGPLALGRLALLPLAAGVAVYDACAAAGTGTTPPIAIGLKWPNDLLSTDGRKLAGILLEADLRGEEARRAILGIGLNVASAPPGAAHLREFRPSVTRAAVLAALLAALEHWLAQPAEAVLSAWKERSLTLGQRVEVGTPRGPVTGIARDLDAQGSLLVEAPDGVIHTVYAGDVQLVGWLQPAGASGGPAS
ncbi:biotin--[acetyl-CoA-carboxylase] ligase [Deinococcus sp.]|uniref:biotin--[acetyl-CoA-carboxylase] ligase n=1 Tax=Deinococcus sp. TaxID=47478 RepID=UPI0025B7AC26|nr:biotin--[acetyl-CoA-carboxylase] ligase [Deinococcus sp.]